MDVYRELFMKQAKKASRDFFVFFSLFFSELIKNYLNKLFDEIIGKGELKFVQSCFGSSVLTCVCVLNAIVGYLFNVLFEF